MRECDHAVFVGDRRKFVGAISGVCTACTHTGAKGVERWELRGLKPPYTFFSHPKEILSPLFRKFLTTVHPIALQRWLMASHIIRFFSSLIPSNQRTNFCNFVTKVNKIAKTVNFRVTSCTKPLELYYDVTVIFSPLLIETFGQITGKQQNIK